MSTLRVYLVIGADRRVRVAKRPQIRADEVALAINLRFPDNWGRVLSGLDLDVDVPDFTPQVEVDGWVESQAEDPDEATP